MNLSLQIFFKKILGAFDYILLDLHVYLGTSLNLSVELEVIKKQSSDF